MPLREFLDAVAAQEPAPSAGAAVAVTAGLAAGLVAMSAGFSSDQLEDAASLRARAEELRAVLAPLPQRDVAAYSEVLRAFALPKSREDRRQRIAAELSAASDVPAEIARVGAEVARLAGRLAQQGNPRLRGEAVTAGLLAAAAVSAAAALVEENLADESDPRLAEVRSLDAEAGLRRIPGPA
jgi:formiminotetrahydrofolate cyclodeaminase